LQDKGYQGLQKLHVHSRLPKKKPRGGHLTAQNKAYNRQLARERVGIEHVNRRKKSVSHLIGTLSQPSPTFWVAVQSDCCFVQL